MTPIDPEIPSPRKMTMKQKARRILMNLHPRKDVFVNYTYNLVRTSKYTLFSFLPKNIFEQFHGLANFYFLSLVILQAFPQFKEVEILVTALPIIIIVAATAIKDGIEDLKRHSADDGVNSASTYLLDNWKNTNHNVKASIPLWKRVLQFIIWPLEALIEGVYKSVLFLSARLRNGSPKEVKKNPPTITAGDYIIRSSVVVNDSPTTVDDKWKLSQWKDIRVGDFVLLRNNDNIPADLMIISTGEPDSTCFIETKNLDGETNLKVKRGITELKHIKTPADCKNIKGYIDAEIPSPNLYTFNGAMCLIDGESETVIPVGPSGLLLRGCILRNTSWLIGLAIYTGFDTKIMLNSGPTPSKRSNVDKQINPQVVLNTVVLSALCLFCGILSVLYSNTFRFGEAFYAGLSIDDIEDPLVAGVLSFFRCLIIFQNLIPIALYISLEVTKTIQSYLINQDVEMWDEETKQSAQPKSWNLCDDLGQIEYIFSDKTGTLTSNSMDFKKASINGIEYGVTADQNGSEDKLNSSKFGIRLNEEREKMQAAFRDLFDTKYLDSKPSFVDSKIPLDLKLNGIQAMKIREFFSLLAVCHTVLVEKSEGSNANQILYRAQSPDEAALVNAAKNVGFACLNRSDNQVEIDLLGSMRTYTILKIIEFNSDRKRMSVIVRRPEGDIILLTKGADSIIYERLDRKMSGGIMDITNNHLELFANEGNLVLYRIAYFMFGLPVYPRRRV
jgi:phospholipid-translocating ATPase